MWYDKNVEDQGSRSVSHIDRAWIMALVLEDTIRNGWRQGACFQDLPASLFPPH